MRSVAMLKSIPNVTLQRMDDLRHFIMSDQAAAFAAVEAFLK